MLLLLLEKRFLYSHTDGLGETVRYYYYDQVVWLVGALVVALVTWLLVRHYQRLRALRRQPRHHHNYRSLKRVIRIKRDLSARYLRPGFSNTIHAVGIGRLSGGDEFCIQVFVSDATRELALGSGTRTLLPRYRGVALVLIEMPMAGFLSTTAVSPPVE
ncbi:MAG TPA: hypothetical protein VMS31_15065, partial [Pyrinomonadaceae bacterium]|nr:hypothetical protein [Pyrinomonadaceae bacterium]